MSNNLLVITRNSIPYIREGRKVAGSVTSTILWQQLEYWFSKYPKGFYKFLEKCDSPLYKKGKSWTEELAFSPDEFRTAYAKIGTKFGSLSEFEKAQSMDRIFFDEKGVEKMYCSYFDKTRRTTHYFRNNKLVVYNLDLIMGGGGTDTTLDIPYGGVDEDEEFQMENPIPPDGLSQSRQTDNGNPVYKETKEEITEELSKEDIIFSLIDLNSLETDASVREAWDKSDQSLKDGGHLKFTSSAKYKEHTFPFITVNLPEKKPIHIVSDSTIGILSHERLSELISPLIAFQSREQFAGYFRKLDDRRLDLGLAISKELGMGETRQPTEEEKERFNL